MTTTLSNLSLNNGIYSVIGSNPFGTLTINQPTTTQYNMQYTPWISSSLTHNYNVSVSDATSNINIALTGSNLVVFNQSSNLFSTSIVPYVALSNYNTIKINRYDNSIAIGLNATTIVRITSSNELPLSYSNSFIKITASNAGQFKDIGYSATATVDTPMQFNKSVKFASSVVASNISSPTIDLINSNIVSASNKAISASNVAYWSSNNLLNKNSNATITGTLTVVASNLAVSPVPGNLESGIRLIGNGADGATASNNLYNGGLASWWGLGFKCQLDNKTRFLHDTRNGNTYIEGNVGIGRSNPSFKLDVLGNASVSGFGGAIGLTVSNNTNPGIEVHNGGSAVNIGVANSASAYSADAVANDAIIRNGNGKLLLQTGISSSAICINTSNNVGIGTPSPTTKLDVNGTINATNYTGATITSLSNLGLFGSNASVFGSNSAFFASNNVISLSNYTYPNTAILSNATFFGCNVAMWSSNTSIFSSNALISLSNYTYTNNIVLSNAVFTTSNKSVWSSNTALFASNLSVYGSNSITTLTTNFNGFSNASTASINALSNYTYNINTSNTTIVITSNINATNGGTIGSLVMSAAGLALGGYNLFNNQGQLIGTIQDALGKLKLNPSTGFGELQSLLAKTGSYTDSVQVGVSTIELSNNTIYFKDGTTSNMRMTSNAITITNAALTSFTISNADIATNCNIIASNITTLSNQLYATSNTTYNVSNVAYWASNNNINRTIDYIGRLYTNDLLLPNSLNTIGSGWEWSNGWKASGANGGYLFRNAEQGGLQFWTGTSNNGLGYHAILTSNGNWGLGTSTPSTRLEVSGGVKVSGFSSAIGFTVSNNTSPGIEVNNGSNALNIGVSSITGGYSTDAVPNDAVIRSANGKLILQSGSGVSSICITTDNNVGIGTSSPSSKLHVNGTINAINYTGTTITDLSNLGVAASNVAYWSSNNLLNKNANASINGFLDVRSNELRVYPTGDLNTGIRVIGRGQDGATPTTYNGGLASWYGIGFKCQLDSITRFLHDTRTGNTYIEGNVGIGKSNPTTKLDVNGTINASNYTGATITELSNLGLYSSNTAVWGSNTARWSSNYGATLCNLATDAWNRGTFGSNAGAWASNNLVSPTFTDLTVSGNAFFKAGSTAGVGTLTHFPYAGDGKNYIRGTTIMADTSNAEKVGIGTTTPQHKLDVNGTTRTSLLIVGSNYEEPMKSIRHYSVQIPPSLTNKTTFDATGSYPYPGSFCVAYAQMRSSAETLTDVFATTVLAITSSNIKFSICRVDTTSGGWGQYPWLDFCVVAL